MRTSGTQFEVLVSFMERHGDLNKPTTQAHGRLTHMKLWSDLTNILNADASGDSKPEEKWKKTWSDLKNNTKRKAAKLNRAATGTGGGPALKFSLTDLEERVLQIINPQSATGLVDVHEVGFEQDSVPELPIPEVDIQNLAANDDTLENWDEPGPSQLRQSSNPSPPPPPPEPTPCRKRAADQTPNTSSKRRLPMSQAEVARDSFLQNDRDWRVFTEDKERKAYELEKERLRLKEMELNLQAKWQEICVKFLSVLEALAPSLLNNNRP